MTKDTKPPRLTRAQIMAGLETVPLDTVLLGASKESRLTPKQREFARNLALGNSKAQAYREAYKSKGNKKTHAANGYKLAQQTEIQQIKAAYEAAIEAAKQRTPAQLREFVIHQLTLHALTAEKDAQKIQALKLLGTVSEVAAFTERKEITSVRKSEDVRAALLEKLRAISGEAIDGEIVPANDDGAESLLQEISKGAADNAEENGQTSAEDDQPASDPTQPVPPPSSSDHLRIDLHNVPHSGAPDIFDPHSQSPDKTKVPPSHQKSCLHPEYEPEIIGVDVEVSSHIAEIAPIVAEKVPADNPTPLDIETPPVNGTVDSSGDCGYGTGE